jgi:butyrate kinase
MCYREGATLEYVYKKIVGEGGVVAHLGTNDIRKVRQDARTDKHARLVLDAMLYQIQKEIGRAVVVLKGRLDAIVLTGGMAHSDEMCDAIRAGVGRFAKVIIYPGEDELLALAQGALRVLRGEEQVSLYKRREP